MARFDRALVALGLALLLAGCGEDVETVRTLEDSLPGAWSALGIDQDGDFTPVDEGTYSGLVFREDGTGAFFGGEGEPSLQVACEQPGQFDWRLTDDKASILVAITPTSELVWTIVDLDSGSLTFEEGTDLFPFSRLGSCV